MAKTGGDENGNLLRTSDYTPNRLNQYTSRTVPGYLDVLGIANVGAAVTVNGDANVYRRGEYFRKELTVANGSVPPCGRASPPSPAWRAMPTTRPAATGSFRPPPRVTPTTKMVT